MSTTVQNEVGSAGTMTADQAFAEAMKFENRPNPYPFFDELRKTPVARLTNGIYVVTGYKEIIALIHDPRISADLRNRPNSPTGYPRKDGANPDFEADGDGKIRQGTPMIIADPPDHDRMRRHGDAALRPASFAARDSQHGAGLRAHRQRHAR